MKAYLRIKIKSLAAEARIIRHAELHWRTTGRRLTKINKGNPARAYTTFHGLQTHRSELAIEQRAALIAYGFLRGRAYRQIETAPHYLKPPYSRPGPNWTRIAELVIKYGEGKHGDKKTLQDTLKTWRETPLQQKAA